jgi:hypothetical protein
VRKPGVAAQQLGRSLAELLTLAQLHAPAERDRADRSNVIT